MDVSVIKSLSTGRTRATSTYSCRKQRPSNKVRLQILRAQQFTSHNVTYALPPRAQCLHELLQLSVHAILA